MTQLTLLSALCERLMLLHMFGTNNMHQPNKGLLALPKITQPNASTKIWRTEVARSCVYPRRQIVVEMHRVFKFYKEQTAVVMKYNIWGSLEERPHSLFASSFIVGFTFIAVNCAMR